MNEAQPKYTELYVVQGLENGIFGGPFKTQFEMDNGVVASITQLYKRDIKITAQSPMTSEELIYISQNVEKLLMLFDGRFYTIEKLTVSNDNEVAEDILDEYEKTRLNCFSSNSLYWNSDLKLISFQDVLTNDLYDKWLSLIDDLDIVYQVFLYALSDNKMTSDLNFAFLAEIAEPLVELLKERTYYCQSLAPGERGTTLRMCIDNLVVLYGTDIFEKELENNYSVFIGRVVKSRVRIMHIKKNQKEFFDGGECLKYSLKFSLLYRTILLSLLGVPYQDYKDKIQIVTKSIDEWNVTGGN